jgi:hypothetical protein
MKTNNPLGRLRVILTGLVVATSLNLLTTSPVFALNNAPNIYSHSWYLRYPDAPSMYSRGYNDGIFDNSQCSNSMVVLDFGQVGNETGDGQYLNYGTYDFYTDQYVKYPFVPDSQIVTAAQQYAYGWYQATGPCPRLKMVLGTNNLRQCPYGNLRGACSPGGAGGQWGYVVNDVQAYLNSHSYAWQITAWTGDDMETGYDCATPTRAFVDGLNGNNPSGARMLDFGDAWIASCWTDNDVYYVSWLASANWPLPEIYSQAATNRWAAVYNQHTSMTFLGPMTECTGGDPLPTQNCQVVDPQGTRIENAPAQAWSQLSSAVGQSSTMPYGTNIHYQ